MVKTAVLALLVVSLAAQPALAQTTGSSSPLWDLLRQLQETFAQLRSWVTSQLNNALDAARSRISPITDTYHAANSIARWLESMAASLPGELRSILDSAIFRFRQAVPPPPGSASDTVRRIIQEHPDSPLAQSVRAREELSGATDASVGRARGAQQTSEDVAHAVSQDASMAVNLEVASASARELAARAQQTPSTRAAVQLLIEGFAAFMDQQARQNADLSARLTALVQQQSALSQQLTSVTEQTAALVELLNDQRKREIEAAVAATQAAMEDGIGGMRGMAATMRSVADRSAESELYESLANFYRRR